MTDRKVTCVACKSAVTHGEIENSNLEFGGELKADNQPTYAADIDTKFIATVGMLDEYTPMVRTTGNQTISGTKNFTGPVIINGASNDVIITNPPGIVQNAVGDNAQVQYLRTTCPDTNGVAKELMFLQLLDNADGTRTLRINLYSTTGVRGIKNLATIQADGTIS